MKVFVKYKREYRLLLASLLIFLSVYVLLSSSRPEMVRNSVQTVKIRINNTCDDRDDETVPLIFIGGVPRSGTTLMRAILDAHPDIRCGEETRILPRIMTMRYDFASEHEQTRLSSAGVSKDLIDRAIRAFILEIVRKHGEPAQNLCNKDPLMLMYLSYLREIFPKSKYILMIRDGRATVNSIITRKVTISGFNLNSYRDCLVRWNELIEVMYEQCMQVGANWCMPVYYEQLVLHPEKVMREVLQFLNVKWNGAVLNHEKFIGDQISISSSERSSDQIIKPINLEALTSWANKLPADVVNEMDSIAPMLNRLGYDPFANPPNYGQPDQIIQDNTLLVQQNKEYWKQLALNFSLPA